MCNGNPFTVEKISPQAGLELGTARSVGHHLTHYGTGAPLVRDRARFVRLYGDNPRALASGLSTIQADEPCFNPLVADTQGRPFTSRVSRVKYLCIRKMCYDISFHTL